MAGKVFFSYSLLYRFNSRAASFDVSIISIIVKLKVTSLECCTLQDTFNQLFSGKSLAERGTLSQLKNDFGHRNVRTDVMNCFNHADNFVRFITEAHVVYLALKLCGMADVDNNPSNVDSLLTDDDRSHYLLDISSRVVQHVWLQPSLSQITDVMEVDVNESFVSDNWCICDEGASSRSSASHLLSVPQQNDSLFFCACRILALYKLLTYVLTIYH